MYLVCWGLSPWKKGFTSVSLLLFTQKLGKSSYDVTITHYAVILIFFSLHLKLMSEAYSGTTVEEEL